MTVQPIFPLENQDVDIAADDPQDGDVRVETFIIGLFLGVVIAVCCICLGKWVL
ncbi:hypothetical protein [Shinella sp. M31]|uniref:hypothetical protein n=1 Tax=Shinella sp. M31 TaxID=3368615 RepID=UPI003B9F6FD4